MRRRLLTLLAAGLGLWSTGCSQSEEDSLSWQAVDAMIQRDFSAVASITTDSLAGWLADTTRRAPLLLDARTPEEYAVSHLPGAIRVDPDADVRTLTALLEGDGPPRPVVVYCSVGYRSARVADRLRSVAPAVANLEGSLFRWANEGRPLVRGDVPVRAVHPYDRSWSRLLRPELRARRDSVLRR